MTQQYQALEAAARYLTDAHNANLPHTHIVAAQRQLEIALLKVEQQRMAAHLAEYEEVNRALALEIARLEQHITVQTVENVALKDTVACLHVTLARAEVRADERLDEVLVTRAQLVEADVALLVRDGWARLWKKAATLTRAGERSVLADLDQTEARLGAAYTQCDRSDHAADRWKRAAKKQRAAGRALRAQALRLAEEVRALRARLAVQDLPPVAYTNGHAHTVGT